MAFRNIIFELNPTKFQRALKDLLDDNATAFNNLLLNNRALIIGKGPVDIYVDEPLKEMDIFVPKQNFIEFINAILNFSSDVKLVDQLFSGDPELLCIYPKFIYKSVFINIYGSIYDELKTPSNLGMTCNQLWYDGKTIKTTHLETLDKISYYTATKNFKYFTELGFTMVPVSGKMVSFTSTQENDIVKEILVAIKTRRCQLSKSNQKLTTYLGEIQIKIYEYLMFEFSLNELEDILSVNPYYMILQLFNADQYKSYVQNYIPCLDNCDDYRYEDYD